jgi:hypothetical protein
MNFGKTESVLIPEYGGALERYAKSIRPIVAHLQR